MATIRDVILIGVVVFTLAIVFFITTFVFTKVNTGFLAVSDINNSVNAKAAINAEQGVLNRTDYIVFSVFIGMILAMMLTGWLVGGHPIFAFAYFVVVVIMVGLSTALSNTWESITQSAIFGSTISVFPLTNYIMLNLPYFMAVIGMLGMIVMFAKPYLTGGGEIGGY